MKKVLIAAMVAMFALGTCAAPGFAADDEKADKAFKKLDANGDGKLSVEEFVGKRTGDKAEKAKKLFAKLDKNSDNFVSLEEFKARKKKKDN